MAVFVRAFGAEGKEPSLAARMTLAAEDADTPVFPLPNGHVGRGAGGSRNRLAAGSHQGEERFGRVDAIPKEVGVVRLERTWTIGNAADNVADLALFNRLQRHR